MTESSTSGDTAGGQRPHPRVWVGPAVVVSLLMSLLATMYLAYVVDPAKHMHDFPVAVVNQDQGDMLGGHVTNVGQQVSDALVEHIPADKVDLQVLGMAETQKKLDDGTLYGAIVIPSDFTHRLAIFSAASVAYDDVSRPTITVITNPRVGSFAASMVRTIAENAIGQTNQTIGTQLTTMMQTQIQSGSQAPMAGLSRLMLAEPVELVVAPNHPLPPGTGDGLVAFLYTLLVLLAGFTGAMVINGMVDSSLGFAPAELGPWYSHVPRAQISRLRTLMLKWSIMVGIAPIVASIYMGVAHWLGTPIDRPLALFLYSTMSIIAVGVTALSILAVFGTMGLLINLVLFVVLGLPTSGGTIPIEAIPEPLVWLARLEPMHQVYLGIRAILHFNAEAGSGLGRAVWMTLIGLTIGLVLGATATRYYDHKGLHRKPTDATVAEVMDSVAA
ncbi:YhgE/Pip domain-containing protein, partial [Nocardia anaemiae]|uniref:YhgE/Pip domain-containing protein n=1 Tax=Nocardia anaemiae TaxID=263910 RepID=UPI0007C81956